MCYTCISVINLVTHLAHSLAQLANGGCEPWQLISCTVGPQPLIWTLLFQTRKHYFSLDLPFRNLLSAILNISNFKLFIISPHLELNAGINHLSPNSKLNIRSIRMNFGHQKSVFHPENSTWGPTWPLKTFVGANFFRKGPNKL